MSLLLFERLSLSIIINDCITTYSYCKAEANMAFRAKIPMIAVCVEDGYEADYWLAVIIAAAPGLDCSTDDHLASSLGRLEKELRAAHRAIQPEYRDFYRVLLDNRTLPLYARCSHLATFI